MRLRNVFSVLLLSLFFIGSAWAQPNLMGPTDIQFVSSVDCGFYHPLSTQTPDQTADGSITTGLSSCEILEPSCSLPISITYDVNGAGAISEFWMYTLVGSIVDHGIADFSVEFYDAPGATGNLISTFTGTAVPSNIWQSFVLPSPITGVQSFTLNALTDISGPNNCYELGEIGFTGSVSPVSVPSSSQWTLMIIGFIVLIAGAFFVRRLA